MNSLTMTMNRDNFKTWLRAEMEKRHWDYIDVSIESDVNEKTIYEYARGHLLPGYSNLMKLLSAFGWHMDFIRD